MSHVIDLAAARPVATSEAYVVPRAGFWRRFFAVAIDGLIVSLIIQAVFAVLFFNSAGRIQIYGDLNWMSCKTLPAVPANLTPPPPPGSNFARQCDITFFGAPTAKLIQVGQMPAGERDRAGGPHEPLTKNAALSSYPVDADGHVTGVRRFDGVILLVLAIYLIAMQTRFGATLGTRAMGVRIIDTSTPQHIGVPLRKVLLRHAAMLIGWLPAFALSAVYVGGYASSAQIGKLLHAFAQRDPLIDEISARALQWDSTLSSYLIELPGVVLAEGSITLSSVEILFDGAMTIAAIWIAFMAFLIVFRRDTVYDRVAGTRVIRV